MQKLKIVIVAALMAISAAKAKSQCKLVTNGGSKFNIIVLRDSYQDEAALLQKNIELASGARLPIVKGKASCRNCIVIGKSADFNGTSGAPAPPAGGLGISVASDKILLVSGNSAEMAYPVTEFLYKYLGTRVFDADGVKTPKKSSINVPVTKYLYTPPFRQRDLYTLPGFDNTYMIWNHIGRIWSSPSSEWGNWVHTAYEFIYVPQYYKSNPEYFALVNGKRVTTQLCYSNKDAYNVVLAGMKKKIAQAPQKKIWSFSQLDNNDICKCDLCTAAARNMETPGGALMLFVNRLARDLPQITVSTLAYGFSLKPPDPSKFKLENNVNIVFCVTQGNKGRDFATDESFVDMRKWLDGWLAQTKDIIIWDYIVNYTNLIMPYPNFNGIQSALQYYRKKGISQIYLQGNNKDGSAMADMRSYIAARLMWNPNEDVTKLTEDYCNYAYGNASKDVQELLLQLKSNGQKVFLNYYNTPGKYAGNLFSEANMQSYNAILQRALTKVPRSGPQYKQLMRLRFAFDITDAEIGVEQKKGNRKKLNDLQEYSDMGLFKTPISENARSAGEQIEILKKKN